MQVGWAYNNSATTLASLWGDSIPTHKTVFVPATNAKLTFPDDALTGDDVLTRFGAYLVAIGFLETHDSERSCFRLSDHAQGALCTVRAMVNQCYENGRIASEKEPDTRTISTGGATRAKSQLSRGRKRRLRDVS